MCEPDGFLPTWDTRDEEIESLRGLLINEDKDVVIVEKIKND